MSLQIRKTLFFIAFFFIAFSFLAILTQQSQAKLSSYFRQPEAGLDFMRPSEELSREVVEKAKPGVLLCIVKTKGEMKNIGRVMVNTEDETGTLYCEYSMHGVMAHEYLHFDWLDAGFYELLGFFYTHGQRVSRAGHQTFFAMREAGFRPDALCASVDLEHGAMRFGYEYYKGGYSLCDAEDPQKESPVYYHTYRRLLCHGIDNAGTAQTGAGTGNVSLLSQSVNEVGSEPSGCKGSITFIPKCHNCSDGGCSAFSCSRFTRWDPCPDSSAQCGMEECADGFCTPRRWCQSN